jgi:hypothetical protein
MVEIPPFNVERRFYCAVVVIPSINTQKKTKLNPPDKPRAWMEFPIVPHRDGFPGSLVIDRGEHGEPVYATLLVPVRARS